MFLTKLNIFARRLHNMIFYTQHISVKPHTNNIVRNIRKIMLETIMSVKQLNFLLNCILHKTCGLNVKLIRQDIALHVNRTTANINQSNPLSTKLTDKNILSNLFEITNSLNGICFILNFLICEFVTCPFLSISLFVNLTFSNDTTCFRSWSPLYGASG